MRKNPRAEELLDRAAAQIRDSQPDPQAVREAAARVWSRLSSDSASVAAHAAEVVEIRGCDDYQALIPAYLAGGLPEARRLLVEEHTRECVPCRRALKEAREGKAPASAPAAITRPRRLAERRRTAAPHFWRWALAATVVTALGVSALYLSERLGQGRPAATVRTADGSLFRVASASNLPIAKGDSIVEGEVVRTDRVGGAVVRLNDGSLVELRERTEMSIDESRAGTTLKLTRGSVIVQAAEQRQRHLYVSTDDCLVSVTGTIFSVNHGTKGSRVSVVQGEVHVTHGADETILHPGEQVTTQTQLDEVPLEKELAWSRDVDHYLELLREYSALRRELDSRVPRPELRTSHRLLDLMPEGTALYAAVPNLGERVTETQRVIRERIETSPVLKEWYESGAHALEPKIDEVMAAFGEFSHELGSEVAVGAQLDAQGEIHGPVVLSDIADAAGLRDFIDRLDPQIRSHLIFVDDPSIVVQTEGAEEVFLWLRDDLAVASTEPALIRRVQEIVEGGPNGFRDTDFYAQIAALYDEGVDILVAGDIETLIGQKAAQASPDAATALKASGASDMRHLLVEQKTLDKTYHRAVLTYKGEPTGIASWLANPAPMGALEFISPDAKAVAAFVIKDPVKMLDDLASMVPEGELANAMAEFEAEHGLSLRDDFAAVLGGEFAFALDGPMLPTPAWKVVVEVYDPARFQWTIDTALAEVNTALAQDGKEPIELRQEERGGRSYYSLAIEGFQIHYAYVEGYLVIAPDRAHLDRSIRLHESGFTFLQAPRFTELLPVDRHNNFSAILFQDMAEIMAGMAETLGQGQMTDEQRQALQAIQADAEPTLGYAYAEDDRIVLASAMKSDLLGSLILRALGLQDPAGLEQLLGTIGD